MILPFLFAWNCNDCGQVWFPDWKHSWHVSLRWHTHTTVFAPGVGDTRRSLQMHKSAAHGLQVHEALQTLLADLDYSKSLWWTPPLPPTLVGWNVFFVSVSKFKICIEVLPIKATSKSNLSTPPKNSRIRSLSAQSSMLESFWGPFASHFQCIFAKHKKNLIS